MKEKWMTRRRAPLGCFALLLAAFVFAPMIGERAEAQRGQGAGAVARSGAGAQGTEQGRGGRGNRGGRGGVEARTRTRKVVLAWADTRNGQAQHESTSHALSVIERLGYESGAYDTFIRTDSNIIAKQPKKTTGDPASGGPSLAMADAIFFMGHRDVPIDEGQKN